MASNLSVYELTNELIRNLHKDAHPNQANLKINPEFLRKCKKQSHEILLKKSMQCRYTENVQKQDPIEELIFCTFEMKLNGYCRQADYLQQIIKTLDQEDAFQTDLGKTVLLLLVYLKSINPQKHPMAMLRPLQLLYNAKHKLMPFEDSQSNIFTEMLKMQMQQPLYRNPYIPTIFNSRMSKNPFSTQLIIDNSNINYNGTIAQNIGVSDSLKIEQVSTDVSGIYSDNSFQYLYNCNWENLGNPGATEYPFASETNSTLHLLAIHSQGKGQTFKASIVPTEQFIADVKAMMVGIRSETFFYNEVAMMFEMVQDLTIENISPTTMQGLMVDFLESGSCFKRLRLLIHQKIGSEMLISEGFVYKTLCSSIDDYLSMYWQFVISEEDSSLIKLANRMHTFMKQIKALASFVFVYPNVNPSVQIPRGSDFLSYVYRETVDITQKDLAMLFAYILQQCCHVYFKNFEKWIFHGYLHDPCQELFIEFNDHYRLHSKYFWDKAYSLKRQSVPVFLQGFEDLALICGKYTMLLKMCRPTHPLLTCPPPNIEVCLSFNQIEKMRNRCTDYLREAQQLCGESISIVKVFEERAKEKQSFLNLVASKLKENHEKWLTEQRLKAKETQMEKDRIFLKIQKEIADIRERKLREKLELLEEEREYLRQQQELEDKRLLHENAERLRLMEYYRDLGKIVDAQRNRAENKIRNLKSQLSIANINVKPEETPVETNISDGPSSTYQTAREQNENDADEKDDGDEVSSVYHSTSELSADFIIAFTDSADRLSRAIGEEPEKTLDKEDDTHKQSKDDLTVVNDNFRKSKADAVNSNNITAALVRNKNKMLSSSLDFMGRFNEDQLTTSVGLLTEAEKNQLKSLESHSEPVTARDSNLNEIREAAITDRQRNRLRIMNSEFGAAMLTNLNPITQLSVPETARERNRKRVMNEEFAMCVEEPEISKVDQMKSEGAALSDLEKNRRKVLHEEFGFSRKESKLSLNLATTTSMEIDRSKLSAGDVAETPMSTGSDTPICDTIEEDIKNANINATETILPTEVKSNKTLKLNIDLANTADTSATSKSYDNTNSSMNVPTASTAPIPTPATELCPQQPQPIKERFSISDTIQRERNNIRNLYQLLIIEQNETQFAELNQIELKELRSLNIATITQFLQMSFVIPMQSYATVLSNEIMKMYIKDCNILDHFKSLRNYFFMLDGEFGSHISSCLITYLEDHIQPNVLFSFNTLHTILENALGSSIIANDQNSLNLSFIVEEIPDKFDLSSPNVFKMLNLSYTIDWPLNLLLDPDTISHYGKVFKYLLKLRRISWVLEKSFQLLKETAKTTKQKILYSPQYRHVQQIRHKLLSFVNALQNHLTANALQASWSAFQKDLETANSMEDLYQKHTKYLKRVEFLCMLNKSSIEFYLKLEDIFVTVLRFFYKLQSRSWRLKSGLYIHPNFSKLLIVEEDFLKLIKYIIHTGSKMSRRGYQTEIGAFINMININDYYN